MIKLTMNELLNIIPVLRELSTKPFKGVITFKIARLIRELDKETNLFEDARQQLAEKYGIYKEDGTLEVFEDGTVKIQENKIEECNAEIAALLSTEIEINAEKISAEAFNDIDITPAQAITIESLIEY